MRALLDPEADDPFVATPTVGFGRDHIVDTELGPLLVVGIQTATQRRPRRRSRTSTRS